MDWVPDGHTYLGKSQVPLPGVASHELTVYEGRVEQKLAQAQPVHQEGL